SAPTGDDRPAILFRWAGGCLCRFHVESRSLLCQTGQSAHRLSALFGPPRVCPCVKRMPHRLCVSAPAPPVCCDHSRHCPRRSGLGGDVDGAFSLHRNGLLPDVAADRAREILSPDRNTPMRPPRLRGVTLSLGCLTSTVLDMSKRFGRYEREVSFEAGGVCPFTRFDLDGTRTVLP